MGSIFCVLKGLLGLRKMGFYGSALIKRDDMGLRGIMEIELTGTSAQTVLVMWDVLVVNGMR